MKRFIVILASVVAVAGVLASTASALAFDDPPCPPSGDLKICPGGVVGTPYSVQLVGRAGTGCVPNVTFAVTSGALPAGLSLSSRGLISGTPTLPGTSTFYVEMSDIGAASGGPSWCTTPEKSQRQFSITVIPGLSLDTTSVPPATVNVAYSTTLTASPAGTQTWTVTDGTLPPGLTLGASNGVISGTPTTIGSFHFAVRVSDSEQRSARREFTIDVANALAISATPPKASEVGVPFSSKLAATGGTGTYTWTVSAGALPPGFALAADGTITGMPTTAGTYGFTASVADAVGRTTTQALTITVAPKLAVTTVTIPAGKVGRNYQAKLKTTGGVLPKRWKVTQGVFPHGIRLDRQLGVISGTPSQAGRYRFTVQATDALGVTSQQTLVLVVAPKPKKHK